MIPPTNNMTVTDTLPGKEVDFKIGDPFWVMQALSDLYSNKELATIRELSTNARDANDEAGNDSPIEITLPDFMNPYFIVKDSGVGMSVSTLEDVYSSFGISTKRDNADANGMLGFGSKAPIAYTGTFSVTTVRDGVKAFAQILKKENRIVLKVIATSKTNEPNGTEVKVPVHNHEKFCHIARDFYRFWEPGMVVVNGEEPKQAVGDKIDDNLYYSIDGGRSYVVMGNVAYRIENPAALFKASRLSSISFVAYVPNGAVEFTPSREDLKYTDHTIKSLTEVISNFENKMLVESKRQISEANSHYEAWTIWKNWCDRLGGEIFRDMEYKGEKISYSVEIVGDKYTYTKPGEYRYSRYSTTIIKTAAVGDLRNIIVVKNFHPATLSSHHKAAARMWAEGNGLTPRKTYIFTAENFDCKWIDSARIVSWDDVKAYNKSLKPKVDRSYAYHRPKGTFDYITKNGTETEQPLPDTGTLYYCTTSQRNELNLKYALQLLNDDGSIVVLAKNRIDKFVRDNPTAIDFVPRAQSQLTLDGNLLLSDKGKHALSIGSKTRRWLQYLDVNRIDDPAWSSTKELINDKSDWLNDYNTNLQLASALGMHHQFKTHTIGQTDDSLYEKYPLLANLSYYSMSAEVYIYMNAKYALAKKGK